MKKSSVNKTQELRNQIRRNYIDELFKQQREQLLRQTQTNFDQEQQPSLETLIAMVQSNDIIKLHHTIINFPTTIKQIPMDKWQPLISLLTTAANLTNEKGIHLLSIIIMFACSKYQQSKQLRQTVIGLLQKYEVCKLIYESIYGKINHQKGELIKMYLYFLKCCALTRIEDVRKPQLVQKYLISFPKQLLIEPSFLILLTYIGEQCEFSPMIIAEICNASLKVGSQSKIVMVFLLSNYVSLQLNPENIRHLFQHLSMALIHLYLNTAKTSVKTGVQVLDCIKKIIAKYPQNSEQELLQKIISSRIQPTCLVLFQISSLIIKSKVYEIEQTIIEKCINNLGPRIFEFVNQELISHILDGLQFDEISIVQSCIKMLMILCQYADTQKLQGMNRSELSYVLEDLSYNKNEFISECATHLLQRYFSKLDGDQDGMIPE